MSSDAVIHEHKEFSNVDYTEKILRNREFFQCRFINCNFTKSDLRGNVFEECSFEGCNFSMTLVEGCGFKDGKFIDSKVMGVDFSKCNAFMYSFGFDNCILDYSSFATTNLKKTVFNNCSMKEVDFSEVNLSGANFTNSDLTRAVFHHTVLEKTDFRNAMNFSIDPEVNKMKKAKFSVFRLEGLLSKHQLDIDYKD